MGRVDHWGWPWNGRRAAVVLAAGCAALAAWLPASRGAPEQPPAGQRVANAEVMIITRGALEGALSPSG